MCSVENSEGGGGHGVLGLPLVQRAGGGGNKSSDFIGGHILPAAIRLGIRRALTWKDLLCITISMCNYAIYYAIIKNKRSKKSLAPSGEPLVR